MNWKPLHESVTGDVVLWCSSKQLATNWPADQGDPFLHSNDLMQWRGGSDFGSFSHWIPRSEWAGEEDFSESMTSPVPDMKDRPGYAEWKTLNEAGAYS